MVALQQSLTNKDTELIDLQQRLTTADLQNTIRDVAVDTARLINNTAQSEVEKTLDTTMSWDKEYDYPEHNEDDNNDNISLDNIIDSTRTMKPSDQNQT